MSIKIDGSTVHMDRVVDDIKRGLPAVVIHNGSITLISSPETSLCLNLYTNPHIVISKKRAFSAFRTSVQHALIVELPAPYSINTMLNIAFGMVQQSLKSLHPSDADDEYIINFMKKIELLPCVIAEDITNDIALLDKLNQIGILRVSLNDMIDYANNINLHEICNTHLTLQSKNDAKIIIYRNKGKEHYAIIIGKLSNNPMVRIHSSCYTGDILGVLTCDCGDQLRGALDLMLSNNNGGVVIYLNQEGRGIGFVNKVRAYNMQTRNAADTVEANTALGFDADERNFDLAAAILRELEIQNMKIITNNPRKIAQLKEHGFNVTERINGHINYNQYNADYLTTKFSKLGHII